MQRVLPAQATRKVWCSGGQRAGQGQEQGAAFTLLQAAQAAGGQPAQQPSSAAAQAAQQAQRTGRLGHHSQAAAPRQHVDEAGLAHVGPPDDCGRSRGRQGCGGKLEAAPATTAHQAETQRPPGGGACARRMQAQRAAGPLQATPPRPTCKLGVASGRALVHAHAALHKLRALHPHPPRRRQHNVHRLLRCIGVGLTLGRCRTAAAAPPLLLGRRRRCCCIAALGALLLVCCCVLLLVLGVVVEAAGIKELLQGRGRGGRQGGSERVGADAWQAAAAAGPLHRCSWQRSAAAGTVHVQPAALVHAHSQRCSLPGSPGSAPQRRSGHPRPPSPSPSSAATGCRPETGCPAARLRSLLPSAAAAAAPAARCCCCCGPRGSGRLAAAAAAARPELLHRGGRCRAGVAAPRPTGTAA